MGNSPILGTSGYFLLQQLKSLSDLFYHREYVQDLRKEWPTLLNSVLPDPKFLLPSRRAFCISEIATISSLLTDLLSKALVNNKPISSSVNLGDVTFAKIPAILKNQILKVMFIKIIKKIPMHLKICLGLSLKTYLSSN